MLEIVEKCHKLQKIAKNAIIKVVIKESWLEKLLKNAQQNRLSAKN